MNPLVIKILALGLTLSQLFTKPIEHFKPHFDPVKDKAEVESLLTAGCHFFSKEYGTDQVDLSDLFKMAVGKAPDTGVPAPESMAPEPAAPIIPAPPQAGATKSFTESLRAKLDFVTMYEAYKRYCKNDLEEASSLALNEVIEFYNNAFVDLPDAHKIKSLKLKEATVILDQKGQRFTEVYADNNRRKYISIQQMPELLQKAVVSTEDQNFYTHPGIDIKGIVRAFKDSYQGKARPEGGSTITQQVAKNLFLNADLKFERKMKEMVLAVQIEKLLTKSEILELYLNTVFFGFSSWGVEMASQSYFGKSVRKLDLAESAMLAGLLKGPSEYSPNIHPDKLQARRQYVLTRMVEDRYINADTAAAALAEQPTIQKFESPHTRAAYYFQDEILRDAERVAGLTNLTNSSYVIRSTIDRDMQRATEKALDNGLEKYEELSHRVGEFQAEGNLSQRMAKNTSTWQEELIKFKPHLFDVQWTLATVINLGDANSEPTVGLRDGQTLPLVDADDSEIKLYDVIYIRIETRESRTVAKLLIRPTVRGASVVLEAKTGRVLAMAGGFSYNLSKWNPVTRGGRPCGSTLKPFVYLSALNLKFQPNTLIPNVPITLEKLDPTGHNWTPHNYTRRSGGVVTIRHAVEQSLNLPTAQIVSQLGKTPSEGLDYIRGVTQELGIYKEPVRVYPFVLGAQNTRLLDMAVAYATVANIGLKPRAHFIETIEKGGELVYQRPRFNLQPTPSIDRVAFYQIRHILEGTVERGTARNRLSDLAGYVAGKTGTTNANNDAWFVGFTNDLVVVTWVGYENTHVESSLGDQMTGSSIAVPIVEDILRESFKIYKQPDPLVGPPQDILNQIVTLPINPSTGEVNGGNYPEVFRTDGAGAENTRFKLLRSLEKPLTMAQNPVGDEEDPNYNTDGYRGPVLRFQTAQAYQPGVESPQEYWQQHPRQVDPSFVYLYEH